MLPALFQPVARAAAWTRPRMDIAEVEGAYRLAVDMPGVSKDNIQVTPEAEKHHPGQAHQHPLT